MEKGKIEPPASNDRPAARSPQQHAQHKQDHEDHEQHLCDAGGFNGYSSKSKDGGNQGNHKKHGSPIHHGDGPPKVFGCKVTAPGHSAAVDLSLNAETMPTRHDLHEKAQETLAETLTLSVSTDRR